jgi:hypothetical protein
MNFFVGRAARCQLRVIVAFEPGLPMLGKAMRQRRSEVGSVPPQAGRVKRVVGRFLHGVFHYVAFPVAGSPWAPDRLAI